MAQYIKNDVNFHGARSKTRVVENRSANQDSHSKNTSKNHDDGWGSITNSSRNNNDNNSNWEDGWGEVPNNNSVQENAWGQDRLVSGKAERNRKFRTGKENNTFRVPIQSLPNWDEVDNEFPSLGSHRAPVPNVWEKRKQEFEEKKAIEPSSRTEEEIMIQQALELSKMEIRQEEERRRQLEEEYRLQTQLLEANPDMFDEFRLSRDEFAATAGGLGAQSSQSFNDYSEEFPSEIVDSEDNWGYSTKKTTKEKEPRKGKKKTEYSSVEEGIPPKQSSALPPFNGRVEFPSDEITNCEDWDYSAKKTTKEKEPKKGKMKTEYPTGEEGLPQSKQNSRLPPFNSNTVTNPPKIPKVVEMFGGWGSIKPFTQDVVETKSSSKSNKWETVDTNFVVRSPKKSVVEEKPAPQPPTPAVLEVKLENTTNWDAIETIDLKSASATTSEKRNYLGTRDTGELNLKDCEPGYSLDQKEQEFAIQSKKKNSKPKIDMHTDVKGNTLVSRAGGNETDACFERERNRNWNDGYDEEVSEIGKPGSQLSNSEQFQCISAERNVDAKIEGDSLEEKISNSQKSIEKDYDFLLSNIDHTYTGARSKDLNQRQAISVEEKSDILSKNSQPDISQEIYQAASSFSFDSFLSELKTQGPTIPEPKPSNPQLDSANSGQCNTNEINPLYGSEPDSHLPLKMPHTSLNAPSLSTFGGYPTNAEVHNLPVGNDNMSHIEPPKVPGPTPEFINPTFLPQPRPTMTPLMNPALMMGMNPMLMQQMMMFSNPFFVQQLQQMDMYYKSMGMPLGTGVPMFPQPMPIPGFQNPNLQAFNNSMNSGPSPAEENGMIPPLNQTPGSQLPRPETNHLDKVPPKVEQSDADSFWFQDYMSTEASPSFIPPPKPTPVDAPTNLNALPEVNATTFASLSQNTSQKGLLDNGNVSDQPSYDSSSIAEVPYVTGWGDIDDGSKSDTASGWNDDANASGWGSDNAMIAKSMRNSSRYVPENKATCRQPASRPYLGRPKT